MTSEDNPPVDMNLNKLRFKRYSKQTLVTNDFGNWIVLDDTEYRQLKFGDLSKVLFNKLEDNFMILTDKNIDRTAHRISDNNWHLMNGTGLHIIIPTLRCNFTCRYCYALRAPENAPDKDMTPELIDRTVDFIFTTPAQSFTIEFSGGEPLLRFDLFKRAVLRAENLMEKTGKSVHFAIITNGSLIDDEIVDFFNKHKVGACLSLDGPKKLHDSNRKFTKNSIGSYDSVIAKLEFLKEKKYPSVNVLPVIVKDSLKQWKNVVDEYISLGFTALRFKYVSRFGFASGSWKELSYSAEEYLDAWKNVIDYMLELNRNGVQIVENIATIIVSKISTGIGSGYAELQSPCGAVIGQLVYDYDGSIYTCDEARTMPDFRIGHVTTSVYPELLDHSVTKSMQSVSNLTTTCDECSYVSFCGVCPLEIYGEEKGFITNIPSNYRCKIHKGMFDFLFDKIVNDPDAKELLYKWPLVRSGMSGSSHRAEENVNVFCDSCNI